MPTRTVTVEIIWRPALMGSDIMIGTIDGVEVGYVRPMPDGRYLSRVMHTPDWMRHMEAYVGSEAQGRRMIERWLSYHLPDIDRLRIERKAFWEAFGRSGA